MRTLQYFFKKCTWKYQKITPKRRLQFINDFSPYCLELPKWPQIENPCRKLGCGTLLLHLLCGLNHIFTSCSLFRLYCTLEFVKHFCFLIHTKWHATYVRYASSILSPKRFNWSNRIPIRCSGVHAKQNTMEIVKSIRLVRRALSLSSGFSARTILYEFTGYFEWEWCIILSIKPKCNDWIYMHCKFSVRNAHPREGNKYKMCKKE